MTRILALIVTVAGCSKDDVEPKDTAPPVETGPEVDCTGLVASDDMTFHWATPDDSGVEHCAAPSAITCKDGIDIACGSGVVLLIQLADLPGNLGPAHVRQVELQAHQESWLWFDLDEPSSEGTFELTGGAANPPEIRATFDIRWIDTNPAAVCGALDLDPVSC